MRKYIHIARCMKPKLTEEASKAIADEYSKLRSEDTIQSDVARVCISTICFPNCIELKKIGPQILTRCRTVNF